MLARRGDIPNIETHRAKGEFLAFVTNSLNEIVLRKMLESGPLGNAGNLDVEMYLRVSQYGKALVNSYTRGPSMGEHWSADLCQ